jgi:hypothetical protein
MKASPSPAFRSHLAANPILTAMLLIAAAWSQPAFSQQPEPGKWIPLPTYRGGSWWLPVDVEKPTKLNASLVSLAGMSCYRFKDASEKETLVHHSGETLVDRASTVIPLDARQHAFSHDGNLFRIMRDDGYLLPAAPMNFEAMWKLKSAHPLEAPQGGKSLQKLSHSKLATSSNNQLPVFPLAMSYNAHLGLLCVVQTIGERQMGSELRIWDVRSRNCLWKQRLPNVPNAPVSVHILDNALVYVSGGYGKFSRCYLHIYDVIT